MKRGHSNAHAEQTAPYPTNPDRACIPIEGGASVDTVRELPSLALSQDEWATIGRKMGWQPSLYILVKGGAIQEMASDSPMSVFVNDQDNQATEEWSLGDSRDFEAMRKAYDKLSDSELVEHSAGCSGDCETMPDGLLACATPIETV